MEWFNNLLNNANDFLKTPAGSQLVFGKSNVVPATQTVPTSSTTVATATPSWIWYALGGVVLLIVVLLVRK